VNFCVMKQFNLPTFVSKTELTLLRHFFALKSFLSAKETIHDNSWLGTSTTNFAVGKPLRWALEALGLVGEETEDTRRWWGDYVVVSLVQQAANATLERQRKKPTPGPSGSLYTFESFRNEFSACLSPQEDFIMSDLDGKVLIRYLERDAKAIVVDNEVRQALYCSILLSNLAYRKVIKFLDDTDRGIREITPVDRGILELKTAVEATHFMVDSIQHKMDECVAFSRPPCLAQQTFQAYAKGNFGDSREAPTGCA
jgi:charged multivesicular body protein 7